MGPLRIKDEEFDEAPRNLASRIDALDDHDDDFDSFDNFEVEFTPPPQITPRIKQEIKQEPGFNPFHVQEDYSPLQVEPTPMKTNVKEKATVVKQPERDNGLNWMTVDNDLNQTYAPTKAETDGLVDLKESALKEEDGTLRMYWIDACEVRGVVYLFGKVSLYHLAEPKWSSMLCHC